MPAARTLIIAGAVTLIAGLAIAFPARIAYQWIALPGVTLNGISGTLWNGQAREASAGGIYLGDVRWRFQPFALFAGRAQFAVAAAPVAGFIEGNLAADAGGTLRLSNVTASLPIQSLDRIVAVSGLDGEINVQIQELVIDDGLPVSANGTATVANLVIRPLAPGPLGDFRATIATIDGTIRGDVGDLSGVLDVSGTVELRPDRSYSFVGLIGTRPGAPGAVDEQLRYLGSADAEGRRRFRLEGQL